MKLSNHARDRANEYHVRCDKILATEYKHLLPLNFNGRKVAVFVERRSDRNSRIYYIVDVKNDVIITVENFFRPAFRIPNVDLIIDEKDIIMKNQC